MSDWLGELGDRIAPVLEVLYVLGGLIVLLAIFTYAIRYLFL